MSNGTEPPPRSGRFAARAATDLRRELLVEPWAELGLVALDGPNDPAPELVVEGGVVTRLDGRAAAEFDLLDRFLVAHGLDLEIAEEAMALPDEQLARMLVDIDVPRHELVRLARGLTPGEAGARRDPPRPGRADARAEEAASAPRPGQPGARDQSQGEPGAARRRCCRGCPARVRRARDDRRSRPLCASQRARAARRLAGGAARGDDPVRGGGAPQPRAGDSRARDLRRDALGVRHRAGLRRRRRHAVVEVVPRGCVRVPGGEGALHVGNRLGGAHGSRPGDVDALPRGAVRGGRSRSRVAGGAERLDLVRGARAVRARRHACDPRRERDRRLARPRGGLRERRDRLALADPQDREAHGPVPARHRLRHLRVLGDAAQRQHVRRRQLRRRRSRRVAHDPARLAGRRWDRAGRRDRGAPRAGARREGDSGGVRGAPAPADLRGRGRQRDGCPRLERGSRPRSCCGRRSGRRFARLRCNGVRRRARARSPGVRGGGPGGVLHAPPAGCGRLPPDLGSDRAGRSRALGRQRSEPLPRPRHRLPPRGRPLGAAPEPPSRGRSERARHRGASSPARGSRRSAKRSSVPTRQRSSSPSGRPSAPRSPRRSPAFSTPR